MPGLESLGGLGRTADGVLRFVEAIKSPWSRMTLDTRDFLERPNDQMEAMTASRAGIAPGRRRPNSTAAGGTSWTSTTRKSP